MADDGSGADIGIPSFLMFKEDADAIKDVLNKGDAVRAEMSFSVPAPDDRVEYEFWTRPGDRNSVRFLTDFQPMAEALGKRAFFTPHYAIYDGNAAGCHSQIDGENQCATLCTNHGRYCANDPDDDLYSGVSGADVVTESLRRICIWSHYGSEDGIGLNWWNYVNEFLKRCNEPDYFANADCINDVYAHSGIDGKKIAQCMEDSGGVDGDKDNNKLKSEIDEQRNMGVVLVPTSFVNEAQVRGAMSADNIFEAICSGYAEGTKPEICQKCDKCPDIGDCVSNKGTCAAGPVPTDGTAKVSAHTFASSMFIMICLFMGAGYWYYNRTREEMREQVRGILAEYMPLEDSGDDGGSPRNGGQFMMNPRGGAPQDSHMGGSDMGFSSGVGSDMGFAGGNGMASHTSSDPMRSSLMSS